MHPPAPRVETSGVVVLHLIKKLIKIFTIVNKNNQKKQTHTIYCRCYIKIAIYSIYCAV
jgi:hypothetical protein